MGKEFTKCNRCGSMMFYEKIYYETEHFWVWKCVYCGEYIDPMILENRQIQKLNREKSGKNNKEHIYRFYSNTPSV
jgi:DNA-directed RNA polymerase subunit M/transcription elongation factor TFIIS